MYKNKYLALLSDEFPNMQLAASEYIKLSAVLNLPKGTEHFIADVHGEFETFNHLIKNASGIIREKIRIRFPNYTEQERDRLAFFIYYPTDMMNKYSNLLSVEESQKLLRQVIVDMVALARLVVTKYTQKKVRDDLPAEFAYVMQELLYESRSHVDKKQYYDSIIEAIFSTKRAPKLIVELSRIIRNLSIDQLHIVGDIFDRGSSPHLVMEKLLERKRVDIQWGNHDILWMGAACGCPVSIANVIRIAARYNNLDYLEDGYGINLRPLSEFARRAYRMDPCEAFLPVGVKFAEADAEDLLIAKIHKAIAMIQFKLEKGVVERNPEFELDRRLILDKIDYKTESIELDGQVYAVSDTRFPTIKDQKKPYELTSAEQDIVKHLEFLFKHNEMLQKHIKFMFQKGSIYVCANDALLFHACIPLKEDKSFASFTSNGTEYKGKALLEFFESRVRHAYMNRYAKSNPDRDYFMYLWQGKNSPLFGKLDMRTFERYFIQEKAAGKEIVNPYFTNRGNDEVIDQIFEEFGLDPKLGRIVNGHIPIDVTKGNEVVLASKRVYLIDGGMSNQYKKKTDIGGYTLIRDSVAFSLVSHDRFVDHHELVAEEREVAHVTRSEDMLKRRTYIYDTDYGLTLKEKLLDLELLMEAYRVGTFKERAINGK